MKKYNASQIEKKWQEYWASNKTFAANENSGKEKKYVLMEFPFPSGDGLHMGHVRGYTAGDVLARYYRMNNFEVMYPIGWDAFGLPAENYAIKHGKHPAETTASNIASIKKQFQSIGYSFDWDREINTTDPEYYKWTQWLFLQFYKAGLAYESTGLINWCPQDKTGLANEEVIGGLCERCGAKVEKKELRQWYLKITQYADKLLEGLEKLPQWPERVKLEQTNWIGKSEGAEINFAIQDTNFSLKVFTTRPDTIFGATYLVIAPEHSIIEELSSKISNIDEVYAYVDAATAKEEIERTTDSKEKTGIELKGVQAVNPATGEEIPVWIADYVLVNYGTGAIMAVPAHDERDNDFAVKFNLPIVEVVSDAGYLINSGKYTGQQSNTAWADIVNDFGIAKVQYRLRDWVFSRQRYWGEPIPLVHCEKDGVVAVPDDQLPVVLPEVENYEPTGTGESPLAAIDEWVNTTCPQCGGAAKRETNTMPQWAGSSWYYIRYADAHNKDKFASEDKMKYWLPVDLYFGGMEHTTLHLLYSRFWNIFLHDQGLLPISEPYVKRIPHGTILASDGSKMSKSKGNVVNPDSIIKEYGADTLRMYELFLGPHEASVSWSDQGIIGVARFLDRIWYWVNNAERAETDVEQVLKPLNRTIKKVTEDIENYGFNTVVSSLMSLHNEIKDFPVSVKTIAVFANMLSPIAPHIAEEIHELIENSDKSWPKADEKYLGEDNANIVVQINGKVKDTLSMPKGTNEADVKSAALALEKIQNILNGEDPKRIIFVQDKIINIVK